MKASSPIKYATLIFASALLAVGCDKDDNEGVGSADLVGTYELTAYDASTTASSGSNTTTSEQMLVSDDVTLTFNGDGTYEQRGTGVVSVETETNGTPSGTGEVRLDFTSEGTYDIVDGKLVGFELGSTTSQATELPTTDLRVDLNGDLLEIFASTSTSETLNGSIVALSADTEASYRRR